MMLSKHNMGKLTPTSVLKAYTGMELPIFGLGTWQSQDAELESALHTALEAGYRLIDTAHQYRNEAVIGRVLAHWFSSGKLRRQDVFITTKLPMTGNRAADVQLHLEGQLKALQLDYVDLYLIHHAIGIMPGEIVRKGDGGIDPTSLKLDMHTDHIALWKGMEKMVDAGLTKAIGLSNFNSAQIERVVNAARIRPSNLQVEVYLYNQARDQRQTCAKHGITVTSYGTLGSPGAPAGIGKTLDNPLQDAVVTRLAAAFGKTPGQVLLRHMMQSGVAIIPKSVNPERMLQNIQVFDFELSKAEMDELDALDKGEQGRRFVLEFFKDHPEFPY